jgi:hypothetical protein
MKRFLLNAVVCESAGILQLHAREDYKLLVGWNVYITRYLWHAGHKAI